MTEREKVKAGLECLTHVNFAIYKTECQERNCPYRDAEQCDSDVMVDALNLLNKGGYWVEEPDRMRHWHCSECGKVQGITCIAMKYCPECGAKMAEHPWAASGCGQAFNP